MTLLEAIEARHAVRSYTDRPIEKEKLDVLTQLMDECNSQGNLHVQLVVNDPKAFDSRLARYGKFSGVENYFAMIGPKGDTLDERVGYYGEHLVLKAQQLGLNTCWVGLTFKKNPAVLKVGDNEKLRSVICLGYGTTQGSTHRIKPIEKVTRLNGQPMPEWFHKGIEAALLAPTAVNQQKFMFTLLGTHRVKASAGLAFFSKIDLGIAKYHFELGAGRNHFEWA